MTLVSGPDSFAPSDPQPSLPGQGDVPVRAEGLELLGEVPGSGYRNPPSLVRRGDGQTFQLTKLVYLVLDAVDGTRDLADIAAVVSVASGRAVAPEDVATLIDSKLRPLGLLTRPDGSQPELKRSNPLLALRFRWVVSDARVTNRLTRPFAILFHPLVIVPVVIAFALVTWWTLFEEGLASATYHAFERPELLLAVFGLSLLSAGFHEFGHAAAARYGGATPGAMGVGLYIVWPAFYTDVTDSYRLGRGGRVRTDLGGVYFNAIFTLLAVGAWWLTRSHALLLIVPAQLLQMIQQMTPLLRFDGYHLLADLTGVPDLYQRIKPTLLGLLPWRWGRPESKVLKPWARAVVSLWVLIVVPLLVLSVLLMVFAFPRLVGTAWNSLERQSAGLRDAWGDANIASIAASVVSILALVVPVAGMTYLLVRLVRSAANMVWRASGDRPARRRAAQLTALLMLGGLAYAWWPSGDNYRPVQAWERGTVSAALPTDDGVDSSRREGGGETRTAWPVDAGELPTRERPVLAVVMVPVNDDDAPTWVFPFNRPLPPGPGDNQALAVNTTDGTVVYEVSFALVWARDGDVLNTNEAYAFASCEGCAAVAIGFQVILAVGEIDVAVPQNLAGAVNYACISCVTYALATQLVITLPGELSPAAMGELATLWEEIAQFGANIAGVPLSELQDRLDAFKARIADVVQRDGIAASPTTTTAPPQGGVIPDPGVSPTTVAAPLPAAPSSGTSTPAAPDSTSPPESDAPQTTQPAATTAPSESAQSTSATTRPTATTAASSATPVPTAATTPSTSPSTSPAPSSTSPSSTSPSTSTSSSTTTPAATTTDATTTTDTTPPTTADQVAATSSG